VVIGKDSRVNGTSERFLGLGRLVSGGVGPLGHPWANWMSPPQLGHSSGNSSPKRATSLAHVIRDVSCARAISCGSQQPRVAWPSPPRPPVEASRRLPAGGLNVRRGSRSSPR
jgi:hypothetical protein